MEQNMSSYFPIIRSKRSESELHLLITKYDYDTLIAYKDFEK